ncbi:DUF4297 family anti-phage-associated protein [Schinkia azotoformans]|uniref:DUF4297 family anti-phage-associated protein n=1 Tax=Schinkia azotoformans TaxID=1454 RepID=UPI002DBE8827|nr:DUF4297 family anti-phage-associated protein [Schinkia azotoformans]MEC1719043.1 hypothetical protein [Schinkia azotoformans]MED4413908.1 hypothetical protein [Schinkia azotoformans]
MGNRDAVETIKGYFYQFDYSILQLLEVIDRGDSITVEGIEDVDIKTADEDIAVQCKYYAGTEYNHSIIAKPIRLMLNHYKDVRVGLQPSVKYYLYGYYTKGQDKLVLPITAEFLKKNFLTYTKEKIKHFHHKELGLNDGDLNDFIQKLTININAVSYNDQFEHIVTLLESEFKCSRFQAEHYYYNNALKLIKELAIKKDISERKIFKKDFLKRIDNRQLLFNEWFIALKGRKQFLGNLRREYFMGLNTSPFERFFLIEMDQVGYKRSDLKELLLLISYKWSNISPRTPTPFCPYVYIHSIPDEELVNLKEELYQEGFKIVDGFNFSGATFSTAAICEPASHFNQIKLKIINHLDHLDLTLEAAKGRKEIYQFYIQNPFYNTNNQGIKHVQIQIEEHKDIREVI